MCQLCRGNTHLQAWLCSERALETAMAKHGRRPWSRFQWAYLGAFAVFTFEPAFTVELEAITALIEPMEFGWRWVTGHRHTSSLLPAAVLGTLSLESPSSGNMKEKSFQGSHGSNVNCTREPHFVFLFISPAYLWDVWGMHGGGHDRKPQFITM